ncbi:TetR family transcriptional regulator [Deinococcus sp. HMF7620]|uniref:TetR family transcriptional regulator n=1 Tax=Deinococcus arboris TaxID=2682977 RepID=A0A7C9HU95_9DEIO|nr:MULTISPECIES: TetR/AcrR family transcriptional regulator [Deinococcus]MBZ9751464.1 TetR/AcrR family transcriptional regulator [Deinococcus betulae]MVN89212.1 TetR family transcriptional regulator [Deinococcus arboris]
MSSPAPRPARARSAEEKHQRRDDILRAAERLWTSTSYAELSMNQVAREAQLAKGTLYLYFDTKEELFLALLSEHLHRWIAATAALFTERQPRTAQQVTDILLYQAEDLIPLRRLLVLLGTVLERNVRPELALEFRRDLDAQLRRLVGHMPYPPATALRVLRHLYAMTIGWQQFSESLPGTDPVTAQIRTPEQTDLYSEFELALRAIIEQLAAQEARPANAS